MEIVILQLVYVVYNVVVDFVEGGEDDLKIIFFVCFMYYVLKKKVEIGEEDVFNVINFVF